MENNFDKRLNPTLLVDGAKVSFLCCLNYYPENTQVLDFIRSQYAYGTDYHFVVDKLKSYCFLFKIRLEVSGRAFVDSAPVLDKAWAKKVVWVG
jgi:epoxyqueuosine reductase